jgi:flagellar protein FlgJ
MRVSESLASDGRSLESLKRDAARDPAGAARQAAAQFEALFMQMVLKSMRESVPRSGMLEGAGADVYQGMLDTQLAQSMTGRPGGLSEMIARQLTRNMRGPDGAVPAQPPRVSLDGLSRAAAPAADAALRALAPKAAGGRPAFEATVPAEAAPPRMSFTQASFVWAPAAAAERATGVPAGFIVGQAALESGWGRQELRHADGRSAHNLFGIKAGAGWRGRTVDSPTTEYVDGRPVKTVERFRAYDSYQEAFADWARLMASNPRYAGVLRSGGSVESFARNLQQAGYATDPHYADKLTRTIVQALSLRRTST